MNGKPIRLLLVEDNPGDVRLLRETLAQVQTTQLTSEGYTTQFECTHVERLDGALTRLGEEDFDVILLDLSLPDSQGLDTLARTYNGAPSVPIIVLIVNNFCICASVAIDKSC